MRWYRVCGFVSLVSLSLAASYALGRDDNAGERLPYHYFSGITGIKFPYIPRHEV